MTEQKPSSAVDKDCLTTAAHPSQGGDVVAWRVRGYNQFKTSEPGPWRYFDGAEQPRVNVPADCDFEPLYATPSTPPTAPERGHVLAALDRLEGSDDDLAMVYRAIVRADGEARDAANLLEPDPYEQGRKDMEYELSSVLPGVTYMDPPDGGAPTVLEQLQRQAKDARRYLWLKQASKAEYLMARGAFGLDDAAIDAAMERGSE